MDNTRVSKMSFASVYLHYIKKAEKKGRTKEEVDAIIYRLTEYTQQALQQQIELKNDFENLFCPGTSTKPKCFKNYGV